MNTHVIIQLLDFNQAIILKTLTIRNNHNTCKISIVEQKEIINKKKNQKFLMGHLIKLHILIN